MPLHYALDHNFPFYVADFAWPNAIQVSRLAEIDRELIRGYEDWEVLLALAGRSNVEGFATNDTRMLSLPREMMPCRALDSRSSSRMALGTSHCVRLA